MKQPYIGHFVNPYDKHENFEGLLQILDSCDDGVTAASTRTDALVSAQFKLSNVDSLVITLNCQLPLFKMIGINNICSDIF